MKCNKCGAEISGEGSFCSECGAPITNEVPETEQADSLSNQHTEPPQQPVSEPSVQETRQPVTQNPDKKKLIIFIAAAIAAMVIAAIIVHVIDRNALSNGSETLGELNDKLAATEETLSERESKLAEIEAAIEAQEKKVKPLKDIYSKSLAPGDYTVGEDLEAGIYHFTYNLGSKDDWGGDYIYVIHKGSKGKEKTLGGTKFDFRVEGSDDGEQVSIKLTYVDKVHVDNSMGGQWNPGKKPKN